MKDPRYDGKPLLRLVELWVLWIIGELTSVDEARLLAMQPHLERTWGHHGSWHEMIEAVLHLPPELPDQIRAMWQRNLETAHREGVSPPAEMFVKSIADQIAQH
ncbi:MAG: hypothetical protein K8T91_12215 [Planctomycetes bacterium]|nr:hypothetical protein [Planctomycetota bacterium]